MGDYKVEKEFQYNGLTCVVVFTRMGHRCGYVGVPMSHPYYGVGYSSKTSKLESPESVFECHGGITYSGGNGYPIQSDEWFFGFDCAHSGDEADYDQSLKYGLIDERSYNIYKEMHFRLGNSVIRSEEYVVNECILLAKQLSKYR